MIVEEGVNVVIVLHCEYLQFTLMGLGVVLYCSTFLVFSTSRTATNTLAPLEAKARTVSIPKPADPPVTIAVLPESVKFGPYIIL